MKKLLPALLLGLIVAGTSYAQTYDPTMNVPSGYQPYANGVYYSPSTELYYDPATGNYSSTFPTDDINSTSTYPGVPNTGEGGNATENIAILSVTAIIAIGAAAYVLRKQSS